MAGSLHEGSCHHGTGATLLAQRDAPARLPFSSGGVGVGVGVGVMVSVPSAGLDIALFGATGFVGRLVARHLAEHAPSDVAVGLAGRSRARLAGLRATLPARAREWPLIEADSTDTPSLAALAMSARVVLSAVGPYLPHGLALVGACAGSGTHYVDVTGEVPFMRRSIDAWDAPARRSGARIVHGCGFDSIPSDLGTWLLATTAAQDGAGLLQDTTLMVRTMRGGLGGGTVASLLGLLHAARTDARVRSLLADPYALSPDRRAEPDLGDESDLRTIRFDPEAGRWVGPFAMAGINTRVVRRSNALLGHAYGRRFRYREVTDMGTQLPTALARAVPNIGAMAAITPATFPKIGTPVEALLQRLLPKPGQGPDEATRRAGSFDVLIASRTSSGRRYVGRVAALGDPGFTATALMMAESGLCLVLDGSHLPDRTGVLTPATALGAALVDRLRRAGMTLAVRRAPIST